MLTPAQLTKLGARVDHFRKIADAYQLVIDQERLASTGQAAAQFPEKLRAVIAQEAPTRSVWTDITHAIYQIVASQPRAVSLPEVRAQLNGAHANLPATRLSNTLARLKANHYFIGGYGKYRVNPKRLPPAPLDVEAQAAPARPLATKPKPTRSHHKKVTAKKAPALPHKLRAQGQRRSLQLLAVLDTPRTREEMVEALRGKSRKRSIVEATHIANAIGPLIRRGYVKRDGDTYVKVRDYTPRGGA